MRGDSAAVCPLPPVCVCVCVCVATALWLRLPLPPPLPLSFSQRAAATAITPTAATRPLQQPVQPPQAQRRARSHKTEETDAKRTVPQKWREEPAELRRRPRHLLLQCLPGCRRPATSLGVAALPLLQMHTVSRLRSQCAFSARNCHGIYEHFGCGLGLAQGLLSSFYARNNDLSDV